MTHISTGTHFSIQCKANKKVSHANLTCHHIPQNTLKKKRPQVFATNSKTTLLWFRGTDLRIHDNPIVHAAVERASTGARVLPVFCYDPRFFAPTPLPTADPRTGHYRAQFLLESVADLRRSLRTLGTDLVVLVGHPEQLLPRLAAGHDAPVVLATAEVTSEEARIDRKVSSAIKGMRGSLQLQWGSTLYHIDDLPFADTLVDMPDVFTPFRTKVESRCAVRGVLPAPTKGQLGVLPSVPDDMPVFHGETLQELGAAMGGVQFGGVEEGPPQV